MIPLWLHALSVTWLTLGLSCAIIIVADERVHPQHMWIMNIVWPVVSLFGTVLALWGYFRYGGLATREAFVSAKQEGRALPSKIQTPFPVMVGKGAAHCGSGCTLGDILAELLMMWFPALALTLGWTSVFPDKIFAAWALDFVLAYVLGVIFQYFTIAPMRGLSLGAGIIAAIKADTLSLVAWQLGMYGFMAIAHFWIFGELLDTRLRPGSVEFWFMMQTAMLFGFVTSYPVNWWLLRSGLKEAM